MQVVYHCYHPAPESSAMHAHFGSGNHLPHPPLNIHASCDVLQTRPDSCNPFLFEHSKPTSDPYVGFLGIRVKWLEKTRLPPHPTNKNHLHITQFKINPRLPYVVPQATNSVAPSYSRFLFPHRCNISADQRTGYVGPWHSSVKGLHRRGNK